MLKLHAGVSKKVGLPNFSSASASCTIEAELDSSLLRERFGLNTADEQGIRQARNPIDELKSEEPTNGHANRNGTYAATWGAR